MDADYFPHRSRGFLVFDPAKGTRHFSPWWLIVAVDEGIIDYYAWLLRKWGRPINKGSPYGPHISVVRGEEPLDTHKQFWGMFESREIEFNYTSHIRWDNGRHVWLDCWCMELHDIRKELGLPQKAKMSFHLTLGVIS